MEERSRFFWSDGRSEVSCISKTFKLMELSAKMRTHGLGLAKCRTPMLVNRVDRQSGGPRLISKSAYS